MRVPLPSYSPPSSKAPASSSSTSSSSKKRKQPSSSSSQPSWQTDWGDGFLTKALQKEFFRIFKYLKYMTQRPYTCFLRHTFRSLADLLGHDEEKEDGNDHDDKEKNGDDVEENDGDQKGHISSSPRKVLPTLINNGADFRDFILENKKSFIKIYCDSQNSNRTALRRLVNFIGLDYVGRDLVPHHGYTVSVKKDVEEKEEASSDEEQEEHKGEEEEEIKGNHRRRASASLASAAAKAVAAATVATKLLPTRSTASAAPAPAAVPRKPTPTTSTAKKRKSSPSPAVASNSAVHAHAHAHAPAAAQPTIRKQIAQVLPSSTHPPPPGSPNTTTFILAPTPRYPLGKLQPVRPSSSSATASNKKRKKMSNGQSSSSLPSSSSSYIPRPPLPHEKENDWSLRTRKKRKDEGKEVGAEEVGQMTLPTHLTMALATAIVRNKGYLLKHLSPDKNSASTTTSTAPVARGSAHTARLIEGEGRGGGEGGGGRDQVPPSATTTAVAVENMIMDKGKEEEKKQEGQEGKGERNEKRGGGVVEEEDPIAIFCCL